MLDHHVARDQVEARVREGKRVERCADAPAYIKVLAQVGGSRSTPTTIWAKLTSWFSSGSMYLPSNCQPQPAIQAPDGTS